MRSASIEAAYPVSRFVFCRNRFGYRTHSLSAPQGRLLHLVNLLLGHRQVVLPTSVARVRFRQTGEDIVRGLVARQRHRKVALRLPNLANFDVRH